jgi:hypothetical protein
VIVVITLGAPGVATYAEEGIYATGVVVRVRLGLFTDSAPFGRVIVVTTLGGTYAVPVVSGINAVPGVARVSVVILGVVDGIYAPGIVVAVGMYTPATVVC